MKLSIYQLHLVQEDKLLPTARGNRTGSVFPNHEKLQQETSKEEEDFEQF